MGLEVGAVDLQTERDTLLAVLRRNLTDLDHQRRFAWLYLDNPAGRAWSWFLREDGRDAPVGVASLFPRRIWLGSTVCVCGQVGDFAVDAGYRSLGPAILLQRATFGPVEEGRLAFCYDCPPHDKGMATFRRLNLRPNCRMLRHARLLTVDRLVRKHVRPDAAASVLSWIGDRLLRLARRRRPRTVDVEVLAGRFGEEFSALDAAVGGDGTIRTRRGTDELNWRFRDDPLHRYLVLTARRSGELVAFACVLVGDREAFLADLFGRLSPDVVIQLVDRAAEVLRPDGVEIIHALVSEQGALVDVLRGAGFRYREPGAAVVAYAAAGSDARSTLASTRWSFTDADIRA